MVAPTYSWNTIAATQTDADSPGDQALMDAIRENLIHLEEWLGDSYTAAKDHDHDGSNSKYVASVADASITQEKLNYTSGTIIIISNDTEGGSAWTFYEKAREIRVVRAGQVNVYFEIKGSGASTAYGQIRVNGSPVGDEHTALSAYVPYSEDIQVSPGDLVQLYTKNSIGGAQYTTCRNFRIRNIDYVYEEVLL